MAGSQRERLASRRLRFDLILLTALVIYLLADLSQDLLYLPVDVRIIPSCAIGRTPKFDKCEVVRRNENASIFCDPDKLDRPANHSVRANDVSRIVLAERPAVG